MSFFINVFKLVGLLFVLIWSAVFLALGAVIQYAIIGFQAGMELSEDHVERVSQRRIDAKEKKRKQ